MLKTCPICKKESKALHMHLKSHKDPDMYLSYKKPGIFTEDPKDPPIIHSDALKTTTGTKEQQDMYVLENNTLEELRRNGISIPTWRLNSQKWPFMKFPRR